MAKVKKIFVCTNCNESSNTWAGKCGICNEWNTVVETEHSSSSDSLKVQEHVGYAGKSNSAQITPLKDVKIADNIRLKTGFGELDRVLGGGLVKGSVILIGGDPGIGKSTLLIQTIANLSKDQKTLYVTGEESPSQVNLRAVRLKLDIDNVNILSETNVERIIEQSRSFKPKIMVIDSIQTVFTQESKSSPGSTTQLKESAAQLSRFAKEENISMFIVGHVTKDGTIAGPKVLEHIVDTVLYFEGEQGSRYRMMRAVKNRFGEVNELGVFAMIEKGLVEVKNPSSVFLSKYDKDVPGSVILVTKEGTRPLLVEIQSLIAENFSDNPRRVTIGLDKDRLLLMIAILQRKSGIKFYQYDVYVSVVGGVKIPETASDICLVLSLLSSQEEKTIPRSLAAFGEISLSGEIRPVPNGEERIKEAIKHGIKTIVIPKPNAPSKNSPLNKQIEIVTVNDINDVVTYYNKIKK
jgi:DNA repair protein RadA/Sms